MKRIGLVIDINTMRIALIFYLALIPLILQCQQGLIPYLVGDRYGMADVNGKIIVEPQFELAYLGHDYPIILVRQNGLWGVMNDKGKFILPCRMGMQAQNSSTKQEVPVVKKVMRDPFREEYPLFHKAHLYQVTDLSGLQYYVNPFVQPDTIIPFLEMKRENERREQIFTPEPMFNGCMKVMTADKKINFIDTAGLLILPQGISNGDIINHKVYAVQNDSDKIALFHVDHGAITDFLFTQVNASSLHEFIIAEAEKIPGSYHHVYWLYNLKGELLAKDIPYEINASGPYALLNSEGKIVDTKGATLVEMPGAYVKHEYPHHHLFYFTKNSRQGLMDPVGKILLPCIYDKLTINKDSSVFFTINNKAGKFNRDFEKVFEIDSLRSVHYVNERRDYCFTSREVSAGFRYGVVDPSGRQVLPTVYTKITYHPKDQLFEVVKDSLYGLFTLKGEMVLPLTTDKLVVVDGSGMIHIRNDDAPSQYFLATKELRPHAWETPRGVSTIQGVKYITNANHPIISTGYKELELVDASKFLAPLFLARNSSTESWYDVLNPSGNMILPHGYGVHEKVDNYSFTISGLVVVNHKEDVNVITDFNNPRYRSGVIDPDGKWVIEPDYQMIEVFGRKFISVLNFDDHLQQYYTHDGRLIVTNDFWRVRGLQPGQVDRGMLLVTKPDKKDEHEAYLQQVKQATSERELRILAERNLPAMVQGAVNLEGKLTVPFDYVHIDPFRFIYTTAKRKNKQGGISAEVVDWTGRVILSTKYPELRFFGFDSTYLSFMDPKRDSLYGLMNIKGEILVQAGYKEISEACDKSAFLLSGKDKVYLVFKRDYNSIIEIGDDPKGRFSYSKFHNGFYAGIESREKKTFRFFSAEEKPYQLITAFSVSIDSGVKSLPDGLAMVKDKATGPFYYFNYKTGVAYKRKE